MLTARAPCVQDFTNALKLAAGPAQRDIVFHAMGADAAAAGDWKAAGESGLCCVVRPSGHCLPV
jgi:hypothetical protein